MRRLSDLLRHKAMRDYIMLPVGCRWPDCQEARIARACVRGITECESQDTVLCCLMVGIWSPPEFQPAEVSPRTLWCMSLKSGVCVSGGGGVALLAVSGCFKACSLCPTLFSLVVGGA
jgi:hypothetical protein